MPSDAKPVFERLSAGEDVCHEDLIDLVGVNAIRKLRAALDYLPPFPDNYASTSAGTAFLNAASLWEKRLLLSYNLGPLPSTDEAPISQSVNGTILHIQAVATNDVPLEEALKTGSADVNARAEDGTTPLAWAICTHSPCIRALIAAGASLDNIDGEGTSAQQLAEIAGNPDALEVLGVPIHYRHALVVLLGSFSPITKGHMALLQAARLKLETDYQYLTFGVVSPVADAYWKPNLAPAIHRLEMAKLAVKEHPYVEADAWEPLRPEYCPSLYVLRHFRWIYSSMERPVMIYSVMGSDTVATLTPEKWHRPEKLFEEFQMLVAVRSSHVTLSELMVSNEFILQRQEKLLMLAPLHAKYANISSTKVRQRIKDGLDYRDMCTEEVIDYIRRHELYA